MIKFMEIFQVTNTLLQISKKVQLRYFATTCCLQKVPRVLPVTHQILGDHNAQYFTPYPQLTREEMEEPPPKVSDEVRQLLEKRRKKVFPNGKWYPPKITGYKFREKRKELIKAGHYFPILPMRDRMLDSMPKIRQHVLKKEERLKRIEENMKMMPIWINEYKEKQREKKKLKKASLEKQKLLQMQMSKLGLNPKDPRAKDLLENINSSKHSSEKAKSKKKYGAK